MAIAIATIHRNTKTPFPAWKRGFLVHSQPYIPKNRPGNCQNVNSARWGLERLNETQNARNSQKTAFLIAPGHFSWLTRETGVKLSRRTLFSLSFFQVWRRWNFVSMIASSVRLSDVLRQMEEGEERFSIRFVKADKRRKTGGQIIEWHNCQLSKRRVQRARRPAVAADVPEAPGRAPDHYRNATRNIVQGTSSQPRKVHIWLLLAFNGQRVVIG